MSESGVEEHETVEIGVVWVEVSGSVKGVVVFDKGAYFHGICDAIFDNGSKGVPRCSFREGKFGVSVCHALWANEYYVERYTWEKICQLDPDFSRQR